MVPSSRRLVLVLSALLVAAVAIVYAPVRHAGFFYLDDVPYLTENPFVRDGLTIDGLRHAFFESHGALWMPLAFTSHMLDVTVFGLTPTGPHFENVALHAANAVLLLLLLVETTGALAPSLAAAALFALHPLRVESVAWIAERKDVLSMLFALLALHAWVRWVRAPDERRYRLVIGATVLALLAKPMMVTLPVLLVLLDCWPLGRLGTNGPDGRPRGLKDLVIEKAPLFALAIGAAGINLFTARAEGALMVLGSRSLPARLLHGVVSYAWYAWKTAWPTDLGVFYPIPDWTLGQVTLGVVVVVAGAACAVASRRSAPWVTVGIAWFVVGLAPVIGIFQAGRQGMADRFTYLPSIGLLFAIVWSLDALIRSPRARAALAGVTAVIVAALAVASHRQAGFWDTSEHMFARTLEVTQDNWLVEGALGSVLAATEPAQAYQHFAAAIRIKPDYALAEHGIGIALEGMGRGEESGAHYERALALDPNYWRAHNELGVYLMRHGEAERALHHFGEAVRLNPGAPNVVPNLRLALGQLGIGGAAAEGYVNGLITWSKAIAEDVHSIRGAAYSASLPAELLMSRRDALKACLHAGGAEAPPLDLFVQVDASGTLTAVTALPPTTVARCVRDELRTARAPEPPFAPFHAKVAMQLDS
jgi:hypothetical protein